MTENEGIGVTGKIPEIEFERLWRRLQQIGLNAYEARTYLVLVGHPRFKALELAARSQVPRQKIYEVLDSLTEKGFAQVVQDKTKLFSAVDPGLAIPAYLLRRRHEMERDLTEHSRLANGFIEDLNHAYNRAQGGRGTLDFLRIVNAPSQTAVQYRKMLKDVSREYLEFSREPYAVDPFEEKLVREASQRGVACRLLVESSAMEEESESQRLEEHIRAGVEVRRVDSLPMKLALFDQNHGMIALLDPVITKPTWTAVVFEHQAFAEAMQMLFEAYWRRAEPIAETAGAPRTSASSV